YSVSASVSFCSFDDLKSGPRAWKSGMRESSSA
ncbi:unnamed protein product, partial [Oikopleura dioica]